MSTIKKFLTEALKENPLLDRAYLFLEDGEREQAKEYFERVLDQNARSPFAYIGKLIISLNMEDIHDLSLCETSYTEHPDFVKALRFSEGELHEELARICSERDACETAYNKALETEKTATTIKHLNTAYQLYGDAHDFADSDDRRDTIEEAISVIQYYSNRGEVKLRGYVDHLQKQKQKLKTATEELLTTVNMSKAMIQQLQSVLNQQTIELNSLGFFKGKRKKELSTDIAITKQKIANTENDLKNFQAKIAQLNVEKAKCNAGLMVESLLSSTFSTNEVPMDENITIHQYTDDKEPLRILKNVDALAVIAKNPLALHEMLHDDKAMKVITSTKKHVTAVGTAPIFASVSELCAARLEKFPQFLPHLSLKTRIKAEVKAGGEVTLGMFPKNGVDPYEKIIPLPGTPYQRPGTPVKWTVLKKENNIVYLVCSKALLTARYEKTSREDTSWHNCELRAYMQNTMFSLLFQGEERDLIAPLSGNMGGHNYIDNITLPTFSELQTVIDKLPNDGFAWTSDKIEIAKSYDNKMVLTNISVASLKHKGEQWQQLAHTLCYVVPKIVIRL